MASPLGNAELEKIQPHTNREQLEAELADAEEATQYLRAAFKPQPAARGAAIRINFSSIPDLTPTVHKLRIEGAVLEPKEISDVLAFLDRAADARSILQSVAERFPRLGARAQTIGEFRTLLNDLSGKIEPDGSIPDHASVALGRLRRDIDRQKKSIQDSLERFLRAHHEEGVLQEEFVAIRNERFVVPVISGQRRKIDGVIHGASSSGHTLFVEPLETIDLNNELVRLTEEEMREVHRILRELTDRLRGYSDSILATLMTMGELELIFAKARFATEFDCVRPRFSPENARRLVLKDARHPLLEDVLRRQQKRAVPISLQLDARVPDTAHQRSKYGRKNRGSENNRSPGADGAVGTSGSGSRSGISDFRAGARGYRGLSIHSAKPEHVFGAHLAYPRDDPGCDARHAGAAR